MTDYNKIVTRRQSRASRSGLGWSLNEQSEASSVAIKTIIDWEKGKRSPHPRTLNALADAIEDAGVELLPPEDGKGEGIRFKTPEEPSD